MVTLILFVLIFGVVVISHEFGHFLLAKANGIHVIEPVAVRRDVLLRERERRREFPGGYAHQ